MEFDIFFQLISLLSFRLSLNTFVTVLHFINFMMMFCLSSLSIDPILWHLSTSFSVISGSYKSFFIMSITDFVTDTSVSFSQLLMPSITKHGRREYCSWSFNLFRNTSVTWFTRASCNSKTTMLLSTWPSFLSRDVIFSFCFVMISRSKISYSCILFITGSLDNVYLVWGSWSSCKGGGRRHFSCCFDVDLCILDFGVEGIVTVTYVLICR